MGAALGSNKAAIKAWAAAASPGQTKAFTYASSSVVGRGVVRTTGKLVDMTNVVVVVRKVVARNRVYFVLTAYPKP